MKNRFGNLIGIIIIIGTVILFWYLYENSLSEAEPYIDPIETNNIELRKQATAIIKGCPSNNKEWLRW